jgi:hypothetical protein
MQGGPLDGGIHLDSNQANTVNNCSTIGPYASGEEK